MGSSGVGSAMVESAWAIVDWRKVTISLADPNPRPKNSRQHIKEIEELRGWGLERVLLDVVVVLERKLYFLERHTS